MPGKTIYHRRKSPRAHKKSHKKRSPCRTMKVSGCRKSYRCKVASGKKRSFCRKSHNRRSRKA